MCRLAVILAFAAYIVVVESTPFEKCEGLPYPTALRVEGCDKHPCELHRGKNATAEWDFVVTAPTTKLVPKVTARVLSMTVVYPFAQKNACDSLINAECPLDKGEEVTYSLNMPVLSIYPAIYLSIQFDFFDDNGNIQVCFVVPSKVV